MASVLFRSSRLAPITPRGLLTASRSGIILPQFLQLAAVTPAPGSLLTTSRWLSVAAAQTVHVPRPSTTASPSVSPSTSLAEGEHAAIENDQPEFTTLEGVVSPEILKALTVSPMKLTHMSPVQAAVLPLLPDLIKPSDSDASSPSGKPSPRQDLLVKARTGTGKTIAFLVPAIEARLAEIKRFSKTAQKDAGASDRGFERRAGRTFAREQVGTVILSPTRELATQIAVEAAKLAKHHPEISVHLLVGGVPKGPQMRHWMGTTRDIVVATPGRLRDLMENEPSVGGPISKAKMFILDEADTLLEVGFKPDIQAIAECLPPPPERQTFLFSATVSREVRDIARDVLDKNHTFINCVADDASPVHTHVPQHYTVLPDAEHQIPHILRLIAHDQLTNPDHSKILLFLPTTRMTQLFGTLLQELRQSLPVPATRIHEIHSKRTQAQRIRTSDSFRNDKSGASVLVSSDVSARGVDYPGITRVIQVGIPASAEQYVHRVGRTGRGTKKDGRADLVLLPWEMGFVGQQLENIPLKPLSIKELSTQVSELSTKHDESESLPRHYKHRFSHPYTEKLEAMPETIEKLQENMDEVAVKETMSSLLGYYISRTGEMRIQKSAVLSGLRDWTTQACGLDRAPHISESFLNKLGFKDGRVKRGMQSFKPSPPGRGGQPDWMRRGGGDRDGFSGRRERGDGFSGRRGEGGFSGRREGGEFSGRRGGRDGPSGPRRERDGFSGRREKKDDLWFLKGRE